MLHRLFNTFLVLASAVCVVILFDAGGCSLARGVESISDASSKIDNGLARKHYMEGEYLYLDGKFDRALIEFDKALRIKPLPALYYDKARCLDRLERVQEAVDAYETYLATVPSAQDIVEAAKRIAALKQRIVTTSTGTSATTSTSGANTNDAANEKAKVEANTTISTTMPSVPPAAPLVTPSPAYSNAHDNAHDNENAPFNSPFNSNSRPGSHPKRLATWIVGGAGLALVAGSIASYAVANDKLDTLAQMCPSHSCSSSVAGAAAPLISDGKNAEAIGGVLMGLGVAAVATSVGLYIWEGNKLKGSDKKRDSVNIVPVIGSNVLGLSIGGSL